MSRLLRNDDKKRKKGAMASLFGAITMALVLFVLFPGGAHAGFSFFKNEWIVGKDIPREDIKEFYYTISSSTNPPEFQRYRFYVKDGANWFYHEKREGNHWPLRETDITVAGSLKLSDAQWSKFFDLLKGGKAEKRKEHLEDGGRGPWLFLYWKGDKSENQEFTFASWEAKVAFEKYCVELKNEQMKNGGTGNEVEKE